MADENWSFFTFFLRANFVSKIDQRASRSSISSRYLLYVCHQCTLYFFFPSSRYIYLRDVMSALRCCARRKNSCSPFSLPSFSFKKRDTPPFYPLPSAASPSRPQPRPRPPRPAPRAPQSAPTGSTCTLFAPEQLIEKKAPCTGSASYQNNQNIAAQRILNLTLPLRPSNSLPPLSLPPAPHACPVPLSVPPSSPSS